MPEWSVELWSVEVTGGGAVEVSRAEERNCEL